MYKLIRMIILRPRSELVMRNLKLIQFFRKKGWNYLETYFTVRSLRKYNVEICRGANIDNTVYFPHPTGIVIGGGAIIKKNVVIHQGVTLGAKLFLVDKRRGKDSTQIIENNVILGAGCKILGDVKIGEGSIIGANAVVTVNIPKESIVVGNNKILN